MDKFTGNSRWIHIDDVLKAISGGWSWVRNSRCKYITLRIDTRNGQCVLKDRYGCSITIEELKRQIHIEGSGHD